MRLHQDFGRSLPLDPLPSGWKHQVISMKTLQVLAFVVLMSATTTPSFAQEQARLLWSGSRSLAQSADPF